MVYELGMTWPKCSDPTYSPHLLLEEPSVEDQLEASWKVLKGTAPPSDIPRLSEEALRKFVLEFLGGAIYTSADIRRAEDIAIVFLPVALGLFEGCTKEELSQVGVIWEYLSKAMPRSINGMPIFSSCHLMHLEDWKRAGLAIEREQLRLKNLEV
jgi:hypothetical protein